MIILLCCTLQCRLRKWPFACGNFMVCFEAEICSLQGKKYSFGFVGFLVGVTGSLQSRLVSSFIVFTVCSCP